MRQRAGGACECHKGTMTSWLKYCRITQHTPKVSLLNGADVQLGQQWHAGVLGKVTCEQNLEAGNA